MPFWFEVALAASGASDQGLWGAFGFSNDNIGGRGWLRRPWPTLAAGDSFAARVDLCHQYSLSPVNNLSPVSTTPLITFFPGQKEPKSQKFIAGVDDTAEKLFTGVNDTADKFFGGVSDTGD